MSECAYKDTILDMPWVLNMPNSECGRVLNTRALHGVLNMPRYTLTNFQYASITRHSEYARIYFHKLRSRVLNMSGFWIWQGSEYARVLNIRQYGWICLSRTLICLNMSEFTIIDRVLNIYHTIHSARSTQNPVKNLR